MATKNKRMVADKFQEVNSSDNKEVEDENVTKAETESVTDIDVTDLNMEQKITIRSIAPWSTGFNKIETNGEVNIPERGTARITRAEVIAQAENNNRLICGTGQGEHATIYIEDKPTRMYLEYEPQTRLNKETVQKIFEIRSLNDFEQAIKNLVATRAEKCCLIQIIRENKFNDFNKVRFCESICNIKV